MLSLLYQILLKVKSLFFGLFSLQKTRTLGIRKRKCTFSPKQRSNAKPPWVKAKVIQLCALHPNYGCRKIASLFQEIYAHQGISISKSYVALVLKNQAYEILRCKQRIKHHIPKNFRKILLG